MKISSIRQQQKRADRYSIYIDDKYAFSLSELELLNLGLKIGQELSREEQRHLAETAALDKAYDQVLNYLAIRPRSEYEIHTYMRQKKYDPGTSRKILNRLSEKGRLNDEAFARAWVENRRLLKPVSKRRLRLELRQKRIANDIIDRVLAADETDERGVLKELVERKRKQSRYQDDLKLMQYLMRQGFNYEDVKSVMGET